MEKEISKKVTLDVKKLPTLSLCMIVRNNEKELDRLLSEIGKILDEIIIVDTGSTDNTVEIAKKYTDKIIDYTKNPDYRLYTYNYKNVDYTVIDDFSKARNESLKYATKDYILTERR